MTPVEGGRQRRCRRRRIECQQQSRAVRIFRCCRRQRTHLSFPKFGVGSVKTDLDKFRRFSSSIRNEIHPEPLPGADISGVVSATFQFDQHRRFQSMAEGRPARALKIGMRPGSTGYDLRGFTIRCRSDAVCRLTVRIKNVSSRCARYACNVSLPTATPWERRVL